MLHKAVNIILLVFCVILLTLTCNTIRQPSGTVADSGMSYQMPIEDSISYDPNAPTGWARLYSVRPFEILAEQYWVEDTDLVYYKNLSLTINDRLVFADTIPDTQQKYITHFGLLPICHTLDNGLHEIYLGILSPDYVENGKEEVLKLVCSDSLVIERGLTDRKEWRIHLN